MTPAPNDRMLALVDESGQLARTALSSRHFTMGAVMVRQSRVQEARDWLAEMRAATNRRPGHELHWNKLKDHHRSTVAAGLGSQTWGRFTSVIVCKNQLTRFSPGTHEDVAYLYALRYLCERISWFARGHSLETDLVIAHRIRFRGSKLASYDRRLSADPQCRIDRSHLDLGAARLDQPKRYELLQIADLMTSSLACAFEPNAAGVTNQSWVNQYKHLLYTGNSGPNRLTSYGLKMHPWNASSQAAHPWVLKL